jgi:hypothetical protein
MGEVLPMPAFGDLFTDVRGGDRTMRVSYHGDVGVVVVSLWLGPVCRGSFRMAAGDLSRLISTLSEIESSVDSASTPGPQPKGSTPEEAGVRSEATAVAGDPDRSEPPFAETGDITGSANRSLLPSVPVLRVA